MKKHLLTVILSLLIAACGGAGVGTGSAKLDVKIGGKDSTLNVKSGASDQNVKTFTDKSGKVSTAPTVYIYVANYDLDATNVASMRKPLTAPEQIRLMLQLTGEEGADQKAPIKAGTYKANPAEKFNKVDGLSVTTFADGKETKTDFDTMYSTSKITGEVRVTSVTADSISGEIDVTDGDKSVKGSFTAKTLAKK